jgi:hypothetical protein
MKRRRKKKTNNNNNKGGKDEKNETRISLWYGYDPSHRHKNTPK